MKKYLYLVLAFLLAVPFLSFAQEEKEVDQARGLLGEWRRNFASPSYGIGLFSGSLDGGWWYGPGEGILEEARIFPATAMDFRIFRGVNVSRRGGFYSGVETGVLFLSPFAETGFDEPTIMAVYGERMNLEYTGGLVFLMAKYGLRADIGIALLGISLGLEMGMGGSLFAGGFTLYTGPRESTTAEVSWGASTASMGLIMEVSGEAALRLGKNFRLFTKLGMIAAPLSIPPNNRREEFFVGQDWGDIDGDGNTQEIVVQPVWSDMPIDPSQDERLYREGIMSQYDVNIDAFALDLRVGFALNFSL